MRCGPATRTVSGKNMYAIAALSLSLKRYCPVARGHADAPMANRLRRLVPVEVVGVDSALSVRVATFANLVGSVLEGGGRESPGRPQTRVGCRTENDNKNS